MKTNLLGINVVALLVLSCSLVLSACNMFVSEDDQLQEAYGYYEQGKLNATVILTKKILLANPANGEARLLLGKVQYAHFKLADALDTFKKAKEAGDKSDALFSFWIRALVAKNDIKAAFALYSDPYFKANAASPTGMLLKGDLYFRKKERLKAQQQYANHFSNTQNEAINCVSQVKLLSISGDFDATIRQSIKCEKQHAGNKDFDKNINLYLRAISQVGLKRNDKSYLTLKKLVGSYADKKDVVIKIQASLLLLKMHLIKGNIQDASVTSTQLQRYLLHPDIFYAKAQLAAKNKDDALAERHHMTALKLNENYRPSLLELVNIKYRQGNIEQAKLYASKVDNLGGTQIYSQRLNELLTINLFKKGELDGVIDSVIASSDSSSQKSKYLLALAYAKKGDSKNTWETYNQISKGLKTQEQKDLLKAKLNTELGDLPAAQAVLSPYVANKNINAMLGLSEVYLRKKKYLQVESTLQSALATGKNDKKVTLLLIRLYAFLKQQDKMYALLNKLILKTNDNAYRDKLAKLYYQYHRYADAVRISDEILIIDSDNHVALLVSGSAHVRLKNYPKAEAKFKTLIEKKPEFMKAYLLLARIAHINSDKDKSLVYIERALKLRPDLVPAINAKIDLLIESKKDDLALEYAEGVAKTLTNKKAGQLILGITYKKLGDNAKAYTHMSKALEDNVLDIKLAFRVYLLAKDLHGNDSAIKALETWIGKTNEVKNYLLAGEFALNRKDNTAAKIFYEKYLESDPKNPIVYNNLSWIYMEQGALPKALSSAKKALSLAPKSPEIMDTVGWLLVKSGKYKEAEGYLDNAIRSLKKNPTVKFHLATLYFHQNKPAKAKAILKTLKDAKFKEKKQALELYEKL